MAKTRISGAYLEDLCFQAQQAAEKAIKAMMIMRDIDFPYVHDLTRLLAILESNGERIPDRVRRAANLTQYAVATRYPGIEQPVSEQSSSTLKRLKVQRPSLGGYMSVCNHLAEAEFPIVAAIDTLLAQP